MARYAIWNKKDPIITPSGEIFSAEQWKNRYPVAKIEAIKIVCAGGEVNGAFFGMFSQMVENYAKDGCDFSECTTDQECLDAMEAFDDARNAPSEGISTEELTATSLASIAASMEYQNMMTLDDVEEV